MKVINIFLIVIFILFSVLGIKAYKSDTKQEYSLLYIQQLLNKAKNIKNYECILNGEIGESDVKCYKRKDYKVYIQ